MGDTSISWTDKSWNPVRGCRRVSTGCERCYAELVAARFSGSGQPYEGLARFVKRDVRQLQMVDGQPTGNFRTISRNEPRWTGEVRFVTEHLADPLKWKKPQRIFVNSMSDLFHEKLTNEQIAAVFGVMAAAPRHTFQILTKRAKRMREWFAWARGKFTEQQRDIAAAPNTARAMIDAAYEILGKPHKPALDAAWKRIDHDPWPLPNVWIGVSVENQAAADERIPDLLATPAAVRFLSCEPLLGELDLHRWLTCDECTTADPDHCARYRPRIDWLIGGCESGPGARPCDVAWLRSLRDQCVAAGMPFFLKQAVATQEGGHSTYPSARAAKTPVVDVIAAGPGSKRKTGGVIELPYLDGVQHAAFPDGGGQ